MSQPLAGRRVVICRPISQSDRLVAALSEAGAEAVLVPLLEVVEPVDGGGALRDALASLERYNWIAFTSANSVYAVVEAQRDGWPDGPRVAAVGPRTAELLGNSGYPVHYVAEAATAQDLARTMPIERGDVVLALLGNRADDKLTDGLTNRGAKVDRVEAYRTLWANVPHTQIASVGDADAVVLTSASIAQRFGELIPNGAPPAVCIGPSTAAAARNAGLDVVGMAYEPTPTALIQALVRNLS